MRSDWIKWLIVLIALLAIPAAGFAQEAVITGSVTDATGGVLPGVTVTALHDATGNTFVTVTDERGIYRIPARVGGYRLTAELAGFTTVTRSGITLLVGQTATVPLQMTVSGVAETVTVTSAAPLLDITTSDLGTNVDPQQMSELPVQGRDWMTLALLAAGNRTNDMGGVPVQDSREDNPEFQTNIDGQQVTAQLGPGGQPRFSRDTIAEFQFIANRFDATQGRSTGVQVNAITRSGTNAFAGSFSGYFRDSDWNAEDHVLNRVVPGSEQQWSTAVGGPIIRDRFHFFAHYEFDREPRTSIANTPWPSFNISLNGTNTTKMGTTRLDYQLSPNNRLMLKGNITKFHNPFMELGSNHPSSTGTEDNSTTGLVAQHTQVLGSRALNEIKVGYAGYGFENRNLTTWSNHPQASRGITNGHPRIQFTGFNVAGNTNWPRYWTQDVYSVRDDFTFSYEARGRHDVKTGGEYLWDKKVSANCTFCMGRIDARGGPVPANIEQILPVWNDADTWNLNALASITRRYRVGISDNFPVRFNQPKYATWVQDDWRITNRLTLNLGVRYDLIWNATNQETVSEPWIKAGRPQDSDNIQPRLGFAYQVNDRTVLRGGAGLYYPDIIAGNFTHSTRINTTSFLEPSNDRRPDFPSNPFNGPYPNYQQALQQTCNVNNRPGCILRAAEELAPPAGVSGLTNTWQVSMGAQRQVGAQTSVEVDYVYKRDNDQKVLHPNVNVTYDQATGANRPFGNAAFRPVPDWGQVGFYAYHGWANYHALQTSFTRRFSDNWQASATYTLSGYWNGDPPPLAVIGGEVREVPFPVADDLGGGYSLGVTDQRHRLTLNGLWQVAHGFQVSGIYFFGSGERDDSFWGQDLRDLGGGSQRLRPNGTIIPRANFVGEPIHRVDIRLSQRVPLGGRVRADGLLEVFNLFDRANYGTYVLDEASRQYGQPERNPNIAYSPRALQIGFRLQF
ncbi:MAG: TonB-dependent receptor [Acidobacteria bacterium]|nr:TonB-dependent receptor [Acidobacteriota bacterium]